MIDHDDHKYPVPGIQLREILLYAYNWLGEILQDNDRLSPYVAQFFLS